MSLRNNPVRRGTSVEELPKCVMCNSCMRMEVIRPGYAKRMPELTVVDLIAELGVILDEFKTDAKTSNENGDLLHSRYTSQ